MIRPFVNSDLPYVLDIFEAASKVGHPFVSRAFLDEELENLKTKYINQSETWIYTYRDRPVGFISLLGNEIGGLFVNPEFHSQGMGTKLVEFAYENRSELVVDVFEENHLGRRFYEKHGFSFLKSYKHDNGFTLLRLVKNNESY
ncbi:GNAT family N-acetyltransferase [Halobacillus litoralis]|uniref:GNAT family N-acetyltransferase n=1 Tax=Halobacillus litoralis TaxID=45668 RepID=UPI001CD21598|nr:GNAT family N-acetyltransferase [Halobacillus litoralis]MCA0970437.1 GNAT family N-acetyltransferase [Halobacillus litoralis]